MVSNKIRKLLQDILDSGKAILCSVEGKTIDDYLNNRMLRRSVEREFEIISEALGRISSLSSELSKKITALPRIIAFRNRLVHCYDDIDDDLVWDIVHEYLPGLLSEVNELSKTVDLEEDEG